MINRWFHRPTLHVADDGMERKVSWIELFYDLIYVAAIIQLGNALSNHVGLLGVFGFAGLFVPIWLTWTGFTFYSNRFLVDDFVHRAVVFVQMFGIGAMAVYVPDVLVGDPRGFALSYVVVRLALVIMYARAWRQVPEGRDLARRYTLGFGAGVLIWAASIFVPSPWVYLVWAVGIGVEFSAVLSRAAREVIGRYPPDSEHMTERYGLLTIIVLGESFVKVLGSLGEGGASTSTLAMAGLALAITCSLWWIYFDDVAGSKIKNKRGAPWIWVYTHLPLMISITAVGVAVKKAAWFDPTFAGADKYRWLLCGMLAMAFFSVGVIDSVTERRQSELSDKMRVRVRFASAAFVLLLGAAGAYMSSVFFLGLVAATAGVQVLFDMFMAPTTDASALVHEHGGDGHEHVGTIHKSSGRQLRDVTDAIRVGTPNELRKDVYFHLMDGSWWRVFGVLGVSYLAVNAVFAALFLIEPESIGGMEPSFLDAFAFSVQTMSTIGYGGMSPETSYGHVLVTVEAAIGLLYVALGTGVILAKIARPHSSVLFSGPVCITTRHGVPTLMFRAGNARGNEVVEASINVTVLVDEVSPEGHRMRVLHDLRLRRNTSPLFTLSWSVMHTIDEDSPLAGITPENIDDRLVSMIVTMQGYDATYAQNTHARHLYVPEDFHFGHKFVDVISNLEDGRFRVDFTKFHRVLPDGLPAPDTSVASPHEHASTQGPGEPLDAALDEDSAEASEVEAEFDNAVADAAEEDDA